MTVQTPTPARGVGTGGPPPEGGGGEGVKAGFAGALTRKLGPLPVWAWALVIGGAGLGWRLMRGGGTQVQEVPTVATPGDQSATTAGFLNELSVALSRIEQLIRGEIPGAVNPPGNGSGSVIQPPSGTDWAGWIPGIGGVPAPGTPRVINPTTTTPRVDNTGRLAELRSLVERTFASRTTENLPVPTTPNPADWGAGSGIGDPGTWPPYVSATTVQ